jgi:branched-subunit amino acid ABC-type transport system permease component
MDIFVQQVVSGLATGGIYASLALALVMIYQATDVVNFAQGEMAMFSTYLAWSLLQAGLPYWVTFLATVAIAFVGGLLVERIVIRPVEGQPILTIVIVTLGLLASFSVELWQLGRRFWSEGSPVVARTSRKGGSEAARLVRSVPWQSYGRSARSATTRLSAARSNRSSRRRTTSSRWSSGKSSSNEARTTSST